MWQIKDLYTIQVNIKTKHLFTSWFCSVITFELDQACETTFVYLGFMQQLFYFIIFLPYEPHQVYPHNWICVLGGVFTAHVLLMISEWWSVLSVPSWGDDKDNSQISGQLRSLRVMENSYLLHHSLPSSSQKDFCKF